MRCLQWWGESRVLIGSLSGSVYDWKVGKETKELCNLKGSVIIMKWSGDRRVSYTCNNCMYIMYIYIYTYVYIQVHISTRVYT